MPTTSLSNTAKTAVARGFAGIWALLLLGGCGPGSTPAPEPGLAQGEGELRRVLPLASLASFPADMLQVDGHATAEWQAWQEEWLPVVSVVDGTAIRVRLPELSGASVSGGYGVPDDCNCQAAFRVTARPEGGSPRVLFEDWITATYAVGPKHLLAKVPPVLQGRGEVELRVELRVELPGAAAQQRAFWLDPKLALPVAEPAGAAAAQAKAERVNVLIVTSDTTRRDALGSFGGRAATPALDSLVEDGVSLDQMYSVGYGTTPSHASLFTGSHPREHSVYDNKTVLAEEAVTLSEVLLGAGYDTAAFVSAKPVARPLGLEQGFLHYDDVFAADPTSDLAYFANHERRAARTVSRFLDWLEEARRPFGAWIHFFDPHQPYAPTGGPPAGEAPAVTRAFQKADGTPLYLDLGKAPGLLAGVTAQQLESAARERYTAEIEAVDKQLHLLLTELRRQGEYRDTLIVFVTDHGENFLDRGRIMAYKHGGLFHEVTRLAAVVKLPHSEHAGSRSDMLVANSDLACTIAEIVGVETPAAWSCRSFLGHLQPEEAGRPFRPHLVLEGASRQEVAVRTPRWVYRQALPGVQSTVLARLGYETGSREMLFDLREDPEERQDVSNRPEHRAHLARLRNISRGFLARSDGAEGRTVASEEHLEGLRALGYLD